MSTEDRLARRAAWWTVAGAALLLVILSLWLVPWTWVPGGELVPARVEDWFSPAEVARAEDHSWTVRLLSWASYAVSLGLAALLGFTRWGATVLRRVAGRWRWWLAVPAGTFLLLLAGRVATLPFLWAIRRENLSVDLTRQGLGPWLVDRALNLLVAWVLTSLLLLIVVGLARHTPRWWFAWAGGAAVLLTFLASLLYPVLVEPLFNRFTPMAESPFKESLLDLAEAEGVAVDDVLVADASRRTTTLNAYVSGIGSTRRIVVYDNLLADVSRPQVRSVVAHELAHARHHDVVVGTTLGAVGALLGVGVLALLLDSDRLRRRSGADGPGDPAVVALALALVALGGFVASPVQNSVSRAIEVRADRVALEMTQDPGSFQEVQRQLALRSLGDPSPPAVSQFWFGSHPTVLQRLGLPASLDRAGR